MPDCFGRPTARPSRRPKVVRGTPMATTSSPGIATHAGMVSIALAKRAVLRPRLAVAKVPSIPAIAARMVVPTTAGEIIYMPTNVVAARFHITDRCVPRVATHANAACTVAFVSTVCADPIHITAELAITDRVRTECAIAENARVACAMAKAPNALR
jgi:hypothetical protein